MAAALRLIDLRTLHPRLLWEDIIAAATAVFEDHGAASPFSFTLEIRNVPGFGSVVEKVVLDLADVSPIQVSQVRRTYEGSRLVELAAIAVAGIGLGYAGGHEIRDVAVRGSAADYLVDEAAYHLEVAGRSRRADFGTAWQQKYQRLRDCWGGGFYLCVCEFESFSGRLAFTA